MQSLKLCWVDTETTGLDPVKHGIIEASFIVDIDNEVKARKTFKICPTGKLVDNDALRVNGYTREQIAKFEPSDVVWEEIKTFLERYVDPYDPADKFIIAGFNVEFDRNFLAQMWLDRKNYFFGAYFKDHYFFDVYKAYCMLEWAGIAKVSYGHKLTQLCDLYGISTEGAHGSAVDIENTRTLAYRILEQGHVNVDSRSN